MTFIDAKTAQEAYLRAETAGAVRAWAVGLPLEYLASGGIDWQVYHGAGMPDFGNISLHWRAGVVAPVAVEWKPIATVPADCVRRPYLVGRFGGSNEWVMVAMRSETEPSEWIFYKGVPVKSPTHWAAPLAGPTTAIATMKDAP